MAWDRFWRWYDRGARVDLADRVFSFFFDWRGWLATTIGGSGGAVTFLAGALSGRSPLDVWVLAVVVAAALAAFVYFSIGIIERLRGGRRPAISKGQGAALAAAAPSQSSESDLKIIFNEHDPRCIRNEPGFYGNIRRRHYSVGLYNASNTKSIDDIVLRALESHFVLVAISPEHMPIHRIVDRNPTILKLDTLSPGADKFAEMFSLGEGDVWGEQDILAKKHTFILEAYGRDTQKATITLEYNPSTKPPTVRLAHQRLSESISLHDAAVKLYEAAEENGFLDLLVGTKDSPDERLENVKHQLIVDTDRIHLSGIRAPSTNPLPISKDELTYEMFPGSGSTIVEMYSNEIIWHDVSLPMQELSAVISDFVEHNRKPRRR
jgi:hypothetical protein